MATIHVRTHVEAPVERVWDVLTDWEGQARWMGDAREVAVTSAHRAGTGVTLRVPTDVLAGIEVTDDMVVTEWEEHRLIGVRHTGWPIRGVAAFELEPTPHGTLITWWEEIEPPLGPVGEAVTQVVVAPWVTRVFRGSLARLKSICESQAVRPS